MEVQYLSDGQTVHKSERAGVRKEIIGQRHIFRVDPSEFGAD
jgi:hypothetical protein